MLASFNDKALGQVTQNPLLQEFKTPFGVPAFDQIKPEHFMPAFEEAMKQQKQNIAVLLKKRARPTFENTIEAIEQSGLLLTRISPVFYNLTSANTSPELEKISKELAPVMSQHSDDIYLNTDLFKRVKEIYDNQSKLSLTKEQARLLETTYKAFVRSGANLNPEQQAKMRDINKQMSSLTVSFGQNLLGETNSFELVTDKKADLAGLPASLVAAAAKSATDAGQAGKWRFTLHNSSVMPFLEYAENRTLREKMYNAYTNRSNNNDERDNKENLTKIAYLRAERAALLGYASHADYALEETMAKKPAAALDLLNNLWTAALPIAKQEAKDMQGLMDKESKGAHLEAWDWFYYSNKVKKEKYNYNAEELRPYFKLENVRDGIFDLATKLYGITFHPLKDVPKYHKDVMVYEVKEANGEHIGVFYMDFFPRATKRGGAWMTSYRSQSVKDNKRVAPVISIVCNFSAPNGDEPALLTPDEVETFFHEFGHATHGLLSNVKYRRLAGTAVSRDFVELPSQIMEHWAFEPEVLKFYAKHYKTGAAIPAELLDKMDKASKFNQGFATIEYLAASLLDMGYHTLKSGQKVDVAQFEKEQMNKLGLPKQIAPRYRSTYFQHIFAGGYAAGYYSYIWSEVLDSDAFAAFKESGDIFNPEIAKSFRKNILERGNTDEPMTLYKSFRGREPDVKYLLKNRGLDQAQ